MHGEPRPNSPDPVPFAGLDTSNFSTADTAPKASPPKPSPPKQSPTEGLRVLVIGGGGLAARELEQSLRGWGAAPLLAPSGGKALLELRRAADEDRPFMAVLLHAHLPDRLGSELALDIQREARLGSPLLVIINETDDRGDTQRIDRTALSVHLRRPLDRDRLLATLCAAPTIVAGRNNRAVRPRAESGTATVPQVLVAIDDPSRQQVVVALLEMQGYPVTVVDNGSAAVLAVARQDYGLVLLDLRMPSMGNVVACQQIRARHKDGRGRAPIIAMSTLVTDDNRQRYLAAGVDAFLPRSVSGELLLATIDAFCQAP